MSLGALALVLLVGLAGPVLTGTTSGRVPLVVGELVAGVVFGRTGTGWVHADDPTLTFLATAGFALVMLVAGSHVPLRTAGLSKSLGRGLGLAALIGVLSVPAGIAIAAVVGTGHGGLYAVLLASSSAALIMPVIFSAKLAGAAVTATVVQVAVADTAAIVALPLVEDPSRAGRAALGAVVVIACGAVILGLMTLLRRAGALLPLQRESKRRHFGLELRWNLILLFALAGLAKWLHVSVMLAGFVVGLVLAVTPGEPRRLARQLFAVTDGFLAPVFFVWLGASLDLRSLGSHPRMWLAAVLLAAGTVLIHLAARLIGQPIPLAILAGAQLGVPVAAVTIGTQSNLLQPGEAGAILPAALLSVAVTSVAAVFAMRLPKAEPPVPTPPA